MGDPFYGVDGNLLVEDLPYNRDDVEAILDGKFKGPEVQRRSFPQVHVRGPKVGMNFAPP